MFFHTAQHAVTYLLILQKLQEVLIIFFLKHKYYFYYLDAVPFGLSYLFKLETEIYILFVYLKTDTIHPLMILLLFSFLPCFYNSIS